VVSSAVGGMEGETAHLPSAITTTTTSSSSFSQSALAPCAGGGGGGGGGVTYEPGHSAPGHFSLLSPCSTPLGPCGPSAFVPLLRILVTRFGFLVNVDALGSAERVCGKLRPPKLRRLANKCEERALEGDVEAQEAASGYRRYIYGQNLFSTLNPRFVLAVSSLFQPFPCAFPGYLNTSFFPALASLVCAFA